MVFIRHQNLFLIATVK